MSNQIFSFSAESFGCKLSLSFLFFFFPSHSKNVTPTTAAPKGIKPTFEYGALTCGMTDRRTNGWTRGNSLLLRRSAAWSRSIIRRRATVWRGTSVAAARLGCGRAADRTSSDPVDSPVPLMAAWLVRIQALSGAEPLISPSADCADYTGCRVTLIETSEDYLEVQFVQCALFWFWNPPNGKQMSCRGCLCFACQRPCCS